MKDNIILFGAQKKQPEFEVDFINKSFVGRTTKKDMKAHFNRLRKILKGA